MIAMSYYVKVANVEFLEKEFDASREQIRHEHVLPSPEMCPSRHKIERIKSTVKSYS